jgi:DNA-binding LytR/AlgR family response regulator
VDYSEKKLKSITENERDHIIATLKNCNWKVYSPGGQNGDKQFKDRFLVKRGREFVSIKCDDIAFFYATHKLVCPVEKAGSKYILDNSLVEIEKQIDQN